MFLRNRKNGEMVKVIDTDDLFSMAHDHIRGRYQWGEEEQEPEMFNKSELTFLSGEALPKCWTDPHYRDNKIFRR